MICGVLDEIEIPETESTGIDLQGTEIQETGLTGVTIKIGQSEVGMKTPIAGITEARVNVLIYVFSTSRVSLTVQVDKSTLINLQFGGPMTQKVGINFD